MRRTLESCQGIRVESDPMDESDDLESRAEQACRVLRRLMTAQEFEAQVEALEAVARALAVRGLEMSSSSDGIAENYS
jgi:hypothetical protein